MSTTIVAIVTLPLNKPSRASARARHSVNAPSTSAAPTPNGGPFAPATKPCANPHARPNAAASAVMRATPQPSEHQRRQRGDEQRTERDRRRVVRPFRTGHDKPSADAPPSAAHGTTASAPSPSAAISGVARSRAAGTGARRGQCRRGRGQSDCTACS